MAPPKRTGYIVDKRDLDGQTKLMSAVKLGLHKETLEIMAEGADIDAVDNAGRSVLHHALFENQQEMAALLLNKGAKPGPATQQGVTPLMLAAMTQQHEALEQLILKKAPLDAQRAATGYTALMLAAKSKDNYAVFRLFKAGADAEDIRNQQQENALDLVRQHLPADYKQFEQEVAARRVKHDTARAAEIAENAQDATVLAHDIAPMKKVTLRIKPYPAQGQGQ